MVGFKNQISRASITKDGNKTQKEPFKTEITEYDNLLEQLKNVEGLAIETTSSRVSLAFLIEEIKKENPADWQAQLKGFIEKINKTNTNEGRAGVSWLLSESISLAYLKFLEKRKQSIQDESLKRKLDIIKKIAEQSLNFNRQTHKQGQPVAFGGISLDYTPDWYYHKQK